MMMGGLVCGNCNFLGCFCHELLPYAYHDWHAGGKGDMLTGRREGGSKEFSLRMRKKNGRMY